MPAGLAPRDRVVVFDAECVICSRWVPFLARRDREGTLLYASTQEPAGREILEACGLPPDDPDTAVFVEEGRAHVRSSAILMVVRHLRWPWPLLGVGRVLPRPVRDFLYGLLARNRYRLFGRRETCDIPDPRVRERLLSRRNEASDAAPVDEPQSPATGKNQKR